VNESVSVETLSSISPNDAAQNDGWRTRDCERSTSARDRGANRLCGSTRQSGSDDEKRTSFDTPLASLDLRRKSVQGPARYAVRLLLGPLNGTPKSNAMDALIGSSNNGRHFEQASGEDRSTACCRGTLPLASLQKVSAGRITCAVVTDDRVPGSPSNHDQYLQPETSSASGSRR
jgi:hypothetical protein